MKHIRLYLFVLFIACSMFMVCPFAYADSMPDYVHEELTSYLQRNNCPSTYYQYINEAISSFGCKYFGAYCLPDWNLNYYYLILSPYEYVFEPRSSGGNWYSSGYSFSGTFNGVYEQQYLGATQSIDSSVGRVYTFVWQKQYSTQAWAYWYSINPKTGSVNYNGQSVYSIFGSQNRLIYNNQGVFRDVYNHSDDLH